MGPSNQAGIVALGTRTVDDRVSQMVMEVLSTKVMRAVPYIEQSCRCRLFG